MNQLFQIIKFNNSDTLLELFPNKKIKLDNNETKEKSENSASKDDCSVTSKVAQKEVLQRSAEPMDTSTKNEFKDDNKNVNKEESTAIQATDTKPPESEVLKEQQDKMENDKGTEDKEEQGKVVNKLKETNETSDKKDSESKDDIIKAEAINSPKKDRKDVNKEEPPTTSLAAKAANTTCATPKNINKKTAEDRLLEEHEKRIKLLLTMETYIKSILILMQKDESNSPSNATINTQPNMDDTMESEQNTTPVPESSDEGGCGGNNNSQGSAFNINVSSSPERQQQHQQQTDTKGDERNDVDNKNNSPNSSTSREAYEESRMKDDDDDDGGVKVSSEACPTNTEKVNSDDITNANNLASTSTASNAPQI